MIGQKNIDICHKFLKNIYYLFFIFLFYSYLYRYLGTIYSFIIINTRVCSTVLRVHVYTNLSR